MTFSRIGDAPERCLHCEVVPADDWADCRFGPVSDLLRPAPGLGGRRPADSALDHGNGVGPASRAARPGDVHRQWLGLYGLLRRRGKRARHR